MISIGISGHRNLSDVDNLTSVIDDVLKEISTYFSDASMKMISSLAEGADRLVVWRVQKNFKMHLTVPLPMKESDYMLDFKSVTSIKEFTTLLKQATEIIEIPPKNSRALSYLAAGIYILDHCDVLIAIWDGAPAKGTGGTAEIVAEARNRGLPIAWVHTSGSIPVTYERFTNQNKNKLGDL